MDNISDNNSQNNENSLADIQFEDKIDIDSIQKSIQKDLENMSTEDIKIDYTNSSENITNEIIQQVQNLSKPKVVDGKKYVIYIDAENIDYLDSLSMPERKFIINSILKEQNLVSKEAKKASAKRTKIINIMIAILTFVIAFPIFLILINKSLEIADVNKEQIKRNIIDLYRDGGKIQRNDLGDFNQVKY